MLNRALLLCLCLSGCGAARALSTLSNFVPDQPSVGVDVQAGGERSTGINTTQDTTQRVGGSGNTVTQETSEIRTERVETIVNNERVPAWIWLLVVAGWLLDSPQRIFQDLIARSRAGSKPKKGV